MSYILVHTLTTVSYRKRHTMTYASMMRCCGMSLEALTALGQITKDRTIEIDSARSQECCVRKNWKVEKKKVYIKLS